jgi:hypothetical protein
MREIHAHLHDHGGHPGLITRLDRVEQSRLSQRDRTAIYFAPILVAVLGAVASGFAAWFFK